MQKNLAPSLFLFFLFITGSYMLQAQDVKPYIKIDTLYQKKITAINSTLLKHLTVLKAEDDLDLAKDAANGTSRLFSSRYYLAFFDKYFTLMSFDKEGIPEGNSVSLKTSSNDTKLNVNLSHKKKATIVNAGADLNLSNNTANIISGRNVTANSTYYLKFSFLKTGLNKLKYDLDRRDAMRITRTVKMTELTHEYNSVFKIKYSLLSTKLRAEDSIITALYEKQMAAADKTLSTADQATLIAAVDEKAKAKKAITKAGLEESAPEKAEKIKAQVDKELYDIELGANAWANFRMGWFSGAVSYTKDKYVTYDASRAFEKKVGEKLFDKWSITGNFNLLFERNSWYHNENIPKGFKSIYLNLGWTIARDNNFSSIKESELVTRQTFVRGPQASGDSTIEVVSTQKVRDITGKTFKTNWSHTVGFQSTVILGKNDFWGLNMGINGIFNPLEKPQFNTRGGLLFRFIDTNDGKSKVNFEIFLQLRDFSDNLNSGKSAWQRKIIGISTTVPFNKVFFK